MYKFNWVKYCKDKAGHGLVPLREKADIDGKEVALGDDPLWGTCNGQDVKRDWCDFIPDAPSKFMVFDRNTFVKLWPDHENTEWAVQRYGRIMEFKGNSETAWDADGYKIPINRNWCRPLTLDDFKREKIAVLVANSAEKSALFAAFDETGLKLDSGAKAGDAWKHIDLPMCFSFGCVLNGLDFGVADFYQREGWTVVPFTSFSFDAPKAETKLDVCFDTLTFTVMPDATSQQINAMIDELRKIQYQRKQAETSAPQEYMEVKRKARVGEKIKALVDCVEYFHKGDIGTVARSSFQSVDFHSPRFSKFPAFIQDCQYTVLVPVRRVHRRAKAGEFVEILPGHGNLYPAGKILKCLKNYKNGEEVDKFSGDLYMLPKRYDVLEGYEEGAKWPEK